MLFNSIEFFVFFAVVYVIYWLLPGVRSQNRLLLLGSYLFYGWWDVRFLYLVVLSTGLDYCCGLILGPGRIARADRVKVSALLLSAALVFVLPPWSQAVYRGAANRPDSLPSRWAWQISAGWTTWTIDLTRLSSPSRLGWWVLGATVVGVAVANLVYQWIAPMAERNRKRFGLILTIASNLLFLGSFKYFNFFIDSADRLLTLAGSSAAAWHLQVILPAGISFYTFQSLSYTIDVYKGRVEAVRRLEDYALFVMFFPVLVAGPIERAGHMLPKLTSPRFLTLDRTTRGLFLILFGLMKKVAISDGLAPSVNSIYGSTGVVSSADIWGATLLFAFQIYCDFSGYTDIARGVGKLLGIDLLYNFNLPYFSRSPSEFWQRWHISLSTWLRDYLYIPLGGNRRGSKRTYANLLTTMGLGGLWHGAAWNFVLWGLYQGGVLCAYRVATSHHEDPPKVSNGQGSSVAGSAAASVSFVLSLGFFFILTLYGWLLFRAGSLAQIVSFSRILLTDYRSFHTALKMPTLAADAGLALLLIFEILEYRAGSRTFYRAWPAPVRGAFYAVMMFVLVMGLSNETSQFIYFQF